MTDSLKKSPSPTAGQTNAEAGPPFFQEWSSFYWLILGLHALIIFLFWVFTRVWG